MCPGECKAEPVEFIPINPGPPHIAQAAIFAILRYHVLARISTPLNEQLQKLHFHFYSSIKQ